jgi:RecB family exonuclease
VSHPHGAARLTRFSPTALRAYRACPRRFYLQYVRRDRRRHPSSPELVLGSATHLALAALHQLPEAVRTEAQAHQLLRDAWRRTRTPDAFLSRRHEALCGRRGLEMLSWYCRSQSLAGRPRALERRVEAQLDASTVVRGKVDRLEGDPLTVIDYKTGADEGPLRANPAAQVYALAAGSDEQPVERVRFIYLGEQRMAEWSLDADERAEAAGRLRAAVGEIRDEREWRGRPGWRCLGCGYAADCPALADPQRFADLAPECASPGSG